MSDDACFICGSYDHDECDEPCAECEDAHNNRTPANPRLCSCGRAQSYDGPQQTEEDRKIQEEWEALKESNPDQADHYFEDVIMPRLTTGLMVIKPKG